MICQKQLFDIPPDIHYLNAAYMSPLLKSVYEAGDAGMKRKFNPSAICSDDFFQLAEVVKQKFSKLINAPAQQIAIIPSASYGLKNAIDNIPINTGNHALVVAHEFPSDYYALSEWCTKNRKKMNVVEAPNVAAGRGATWTEKLLDAISPETSVVVISSIHWADGTLFNLKRIGEKCKKVNARFIVDGTQSVGALPVDVTEFQIDALICAAYKWLMGPYSIGLAYYREVYNDGIPIEDSWMNRTNANDFTSLNQYAHEYKPGAARYNVGEYSNFILLPMLDRALEQIHEWRPEAVQEYCRILIQPLVNYLQDNGYWVEENNYRANHLFGFILPETVDKETLLQELQKRKVFVSVRGDAIRISPHVYNDAVDIEVLIDTLRKNRS